MYILWPMEHFKTGDKQIHWHEGHLMHPTCEGTLRVVHLLNCVLASVEYAAEYPQHTPTNTKSNLQ